MVYDKRAVQDRMEGLGFEFDQDGLLIDSEEGRMKFTALIELMADHLLFWLDESEDSRQELLESAEEYLVG